MSLKARLKRMKSHMNLDTKQKIDINFSQKDIPFQEKWAELNCRPYYWQDVYSLIREISYPVDHCHGKYSLQELHEISQKWEETSVNHPLSIQNIPISNLLFFDTETTGLHGGSGNYIFLIGYAMVTDDQVLIKQHILPDPTAEVAMYDAFLSDFDQEKKLVSFNGKAFDWPQVKTRHVFVRDYVPDLPTFAHFDLLHPSRRLWKQLLPSCKLSVVEKEILGFEREDDTPGYLAPMLYFDFLNEKDPEFLEGIIRHNEWDVLSLISLYIHLSKQILLLHDLHPREAFEIGRWFEQLSEYEKAIDFYQLALKEQGASNGEIYVHIGKCYKKLKKNDEAIFWLEEGITHTAFFPIEGIVELAMIFEHERKDFEKGLFYAKLAYERAKENKRVLKKRDDCPLNEILHRIARLEKKIAIRK